MIVVRHTGRESEARVRRYTEHREVNGGAGSEPNAVELSTLTYQIVGRQPFAAGTNRVPSRHRDADLLLNTTVLPSHKNIATATWYKRAKEKSRKQQKENRNQKTEFRNHQGEPNTNRKPKLTFRVSVWFLSRIAQRTLPV